jgi:hypothetical protein
LRAKIKRLLFGLALGAALTGPAMAEEQLVMPFACRVEGGRVLLAPSAPQAYQIYGHRQHKRLTTCSPYNRKRCHHWSIHRFDLDCGGVRTSWQSVVTALTPMLAKDLGAPDGAADAGQAPPAAYASQPRGRPYRPGRGRAIRFPPGFAPNPMMVASFKQTKAAPAQIALPPKKPVSTAPSQTAEVDGDLKPTAAPSQTAEIEPSAKPAAAPSSSAGKTEVAGKTASTEQKATQVAKYEPLEIEVDSGSGEVTGSLPKSGTTSGTLWQDAAMVFALTLAALLALSATLLLRRRGMLPAPISVPQLPYGAAPSPSLTRASNSDFDRAAAHRQSDVPGSRLRLWDEDWLPATMSEALDVLGVDPDASRDRMKTTVTRLRRALHPDHALDEEDRRLRERRLKKINVAWDIVSGKRRALWLSRTPRSS